jgi:DNA-directed RNA polymerase specialized sigma subunit
MTDKEVEDKFCEKDPGALALIYNQFAEKALGFFVNEYPLVDNYVIKDVICDSLIALAEHPEKYNPEKKASLKTFIYKDIEGNLKNELEKAKRPRHRFKQSGVELDKISGNIDNEKLPGELLEIQELKEQVDEFISSIFQNEIDRKLAWMIAIEKERLTEEYTEILGLGSLHPREQASVVKQNKDRIAIHLKRKGWAEFIEKLKRNG